MSFSVLAEICDWFPVSDVAGAFIASAVLRDKLNVRYKTTTISMDYNYEITSVYGLRNY